jgi:hypothetical protein
MDLINFKRINESIYPVKYLVRDQRSEFNWDELTI